MNRLSFDLGLRLLGNDTFPRTMSGVGPLVSVFARNAIVIAGILSILLIVAGGFGMIMGAGGDNPQNAAKGRQAATAGVIGFLLVFAAYWIVEIVQVVTGVAIF